MSASNLVLSPRILGIVKDFAIYCAKRKQICSTLPPLARYTKQLVIVGSADSSVGDGVSILLYCHISNQLYFSLPFQIVDYQKNIVHFDGSFMIPDKYFHAYYEPCWSQKTSPLAAIKNFIGYWQDVLVLYKYLLFKRYFSLMLRFSQFRTFLWCLQNRLQRLLKAEWLHLNIRVNCCELKPLGLDKRTNSCIRVNTRELDRELDREPFTKQSTLYIYLDGLY